MNKKRVAEALNRTRSRLVPFIVADIKANHGTLEAAQAKGLYRFSEGGGDGDAYESDIRAYLSDGAK